VCFLCLLGILHPTPPQLRRPTAVVSRPVTIVSIAHRILPRERFLASRLFPRPYRLYLALAFALYGIMALHVPECWRGALNALLFVHMSKAMKPPELRKYFDNLGGNNFGESVRLFTRLLADY